MSGICLYGNTDGKFYIHGQPGPDPGKPCVVDTFAVCSFAAKVSTTQGLPGSGVWTLNI